MTDTASTLQAALDGLARGWSVIPLCPADHSGVFKAHRGCSSPGKRPYFPTKADGASGEWKEYQTRLATEDEVRAWYSMHPRLNLGVALGPVSGIVAIDVDDEEGDELLETMACGDLPRTWEYTTGKGRRLIYRLPTGVHVRSAPFKRLGTEIEILRIMGQGGQIVLPPSIHPNGSTYTWKTLQGPDDISAADVPKWMHSKLAPEPSSKSSLADGEAIDEGGRNNHLFTLACAMRRRGADEEAIYAALDSTNQRRCNPPLEDFEIRKTAQSAAKYDPDTTPTVTFGPPKPPPPPTEYTRTFKWASELQAYEKADEWIWEGYLAPGGITMLSAHPKMGKTTLLSHLLTAIATDGEFLGQKIKASKVLYISEEGEQHWVRRRDNLGFGDHAAFYLQPFGVKPSSEDWLGFVEKLKTDVTTHGFTLVVIDTLAKLWPVKEENDPGVVDAALMPLWAITKAGAAVLMIHHLRKSGGHEFTASRGSGALAAFPDILMELTSFDPLDRKSRRRVLRAKGRYDETPDEMTIEMTDGRYVRIPDSDEPTVVIGGDGKAHNPDDEEHKVLSVLQVCKSVWLTMEGIREGLKAMRMGMRNSNLKVVIDSLIFRSLISCRGELRNKTDPKQYALTKRVPDGSSRSAPGCVSGNEMPERDNSASETSRSHISFPPETQGRNEMSEDNPHLVNLDAEEKPQPLFWTELRHILRVNGPQTLARLHELSGYELEEIKDGMGFFIGVNLVRENEDGTYESISREKAP